jgi:hypothetical protein
VLLQLLLMILMHLLHLCLSIATTTAAASWPCHWRGHRLRSSQMVGMLLQRMELPVCIGRGTC